MTIARSRASRHTATAFLAALLIVTGLVTTGCSLKEQAVQSLALVNQERARRGTPPLAWNDEAAAKAEAWAAYLASRGELEHSNLADGIVTDWRVLGENVGYADSVNRVHAGFMRSPAHRATLLAGKYRQVGVGVAQGDGVIFIVQVFRG